MRLLAVTLCRVDAPPIAWADPIEDAAIRVIKKLEGRVQENGKVVDLSSTPVTDAQLKVLAALRNLTSLDLSDTGVTGAGIKELTGLQNLTELHRRGPATYITAPQTARKPLLHDVGMKELAALQNLTTPCFSSREDLTDEGVKRLATLKNLTILDLRDVELSDTGLMDLSAIPGLTQLGLNMSRISDAGMKQFQQRNPRCDLSAPPWSEAIKR